jgi:hypothetical protein
MHLKILFLPTLIPLSEVSSWYNMFSSCCDKDSAFICTTGRLPDDLETRVDANDCKCSRDQQLNVPSEARTMHLKIIFLNYRVSFTS